MLKRNEFRALKINANKNFSTFYNKFNVLRPYLASSLRNNDEELKEALYKRLNTIYLNNIRSTRLPTLRLIVDYLRILEVAYIRERQFAPAPILGIGGRSRG